MPYDGAVVLKIKGTMLMPLHHTEPYRIPFDVPELAFDEAVRLAADTGTIPGDAGPLLETVVDMLDELGRPDQAFDVLQVAGTNGKSSTVRFTEAILRGEGCRTALYTSPHLVRYPERMEICGRVVADDVFAHGVSAAAEAGRRVNARRVEEGRQRYTITPFDLLTVAALVAFAEAGVEVAVLEVGLGGRWDATSATNPVGVAVTGIGLDHMRILGNTLAEIAAEKAAVIKPGRFAVLGEGTHEPEVQQVMDERCAACGVTPVVVRHEVISLPRFMGDDLAVRCPAPRALIRCASLSPLTKHRTLPAPLIWPRSISGDPSTKRCSMRAWLRAPRPGASMCSRATRFS